MEEIARRLDLKYNPVVTKWESLLVGIIAGKFDISGSAMGINEERQKQVLFADAWVESGRDFLCTRIQTSSRGRCDGQEGRRNRRIDFHSRG